MGRHEAWPDGPTYDYGDHTPPGAVGRATVSSPLPELPLARARQLPRDSWLLNLRPYPGGEPARNSGPRWPA